MTPPRPTPHRRGFTLIELLVVVAVIALLIGLLLPALGAASRSAVKLQCQSNLRQIAIAEAMYAEDYETIVFPDIPKDAVWKDPADRSRNITKNLKWIHLLGSYTGMSNSNRESRSEVFRCPNFKPQYSERELMDGASPSGNTDVRTGYGMNRRLLSPESRTRYHYVGPTIFDQFGDSFSIKLSAESGGVHDEDLQGYVRPPWNRARVQAPSSRIIFGNSGGNYLDPTIATTSRTFWTNSLDEEGDPDSSGDPRRHSGGVYRRTDQPNRALDEDWLTGDANYVFMDGHARTIESLEAVQLIIDPLRKEHPVEEIMETWD